ncbi:winged helix-turn-helix domain-containing protein [uncultured Roseobacter sp.]|uniref:ArsR/SmtB family transcription factor n=1 Tax=uncultured Roseobacter sp. TaxID=114847 RepID=UPI00261A9D49|nr:winged helix-turn-helix domain-containing protein [uncultured Roseobacter sp.]
MKEGPDISHVASLIGDPARANMLTALMGGQALTASELAAEAGVTLQTASAHLSKLAGGGLLSPRKSGRHKYFALASDEVAQVLEALMGLAAGSGQPRRRPGPKDARLRQARICYKHLAGSMGTRMFDSLLTQGHLLQQDEEIRLTPKGTGFVEGFGIDLDGLRSARTPLCRACLDWSERRSHLAGSLGRAFLHRFETLGWITVCTESRVVTFSADGAEGFAQLFGRC